MVEKTRVTEEEVAKVIVIARTALDAAIDSVVTRLWETTPAIVVHAAFQAAMLEKAGELAKLSFHTSRVDYAAAAGVFYEDDKKVKPPDDS